MTDIDTLAAKIRAGLDAEAEEAQHIPDGLWWVEERDSRFWGDVRDAEVACSQGTVAILPEGKGGHLKAPHIARHDPETVLRRVARDRRLLDLLLAEEHGPVWSDPGRRFYHCASEAQDPCDCGRDARVAAYLAVLAESYEETAG